MENWKVVWMIRRRIETLYMQIFMKDMLFGSCSWLAKAYYLCVWMWGGLPILNVNFFSKHRSNVGDKFSKRTYIRGCWLFKTDGKRASTEECEISPLTWHASVRSDSVSAYKVFASSQLTTFFKYSLPFIKRASKYCQDLSILPQIDATESAFAGIA